MPRSHHACFLLGHLDVEEAAAGAHPLHAAGLQQADVADALAVAHAALQHEDFRAGRLG